MGQNRDLSKFPNAITVLDNGNVGIGLTNPFAGLSYASGLQIKFTSNNAFLRLTSSTYTGIDLIHLTDGNAVLWNRDNAYLAFGTNDLERFRVTSSGNFIVGTGITSTNITAYIYSTSHGSNPALWARCVTNEVPVSLFNDGNTISTIGFKGTTTDNEYAVRCGANGNAFVAYTNNIEKLRISSSGTVEVKNTLITGTSISSTQYVSFSENQMWRTGGGTLYINSSGSGNVNIAGGGGYVNMPSQPSFYATSTAGSSDYTSSEVIVFNTARHNTGGHYNTSNGRFTAPVTGRYQFSLNLYAYGSYRFSVTLTVNGSQYSPQDLSPLAYHENTVGEMTTGFTVVLELSTGDYVEVRCRAGYTSRIYRAHSTFCGQLLS